MIDAGENHKNGMNGHNGHSSNGNGIPADYFPPPVLDDDGLFSADGPVDPTCDPLESDDDSSKNGKGQVLLVSRVVEANWQPTQRNLKAYEALCETGDYKRVAIEYRTSVRQLELLGRKIDAWVKSQHMDEIWSVRVRQKKMLEKLYVRAINGYEISQGDEVTRKTGIGANGEKIDQTTVKARGEGNPNFLMLAREILSDIRKLTGADKAPAEGVTGDNFSVSQFNSRRDAIEARMRLMESALKGLPE